MGLQHLDLVFHDISVPESEDVVANSLLVPICLVVVVVVEILVDGRRVSVL